MFFFTRTLGWGLGGTRTQIIQTLGRRDLSGCFSVHICAFHSSYSSYFAFLYPFLSLRSGTKRYEKGFDTEHFVL